MGSKTYASIIVLIFSIAAYFTLYFTSKDKSLNETPLRNNVGTKEILLTQEQLQQYNGIDNPKLYLSILGQVFDVTSGSDHYGPGKSYHFFTGKDSSRSFITGNFGENDADDDVKGLTNEELLSLDNWLKFYKTQYKRIGKLVARYYDEDGKLTEYGKEIKKMIIDAFRHKQNDQLLKDLYPPCNTEWSAEKGTRVWCTSKSGGVDRNWAGVPRQLFETVGGGERCACVNLETVDLSKINFKEYKGCDGTATSCFILENPVDQ